MEHVILLIDGMTCIKVNITELLCLQLTISF